MRSNTIVKEELGLTKHLIKEKVTEVTGVETSKLTKSV